MSLKNMPNHSEGSNDDPRLNHFIAYGLDYLREKNEKFDEILS